MPVLLQDIMQYQHPHLLITVSLECFLGLSGFCCLTVLIDYPLYPVSFVDPYTVIPSYGSTNKDNSFGWSLGGETQTVSQSYSEDLIFLIDPDGVQLSIPWHEINTWPVRKYIFNFLRIS